MSKPNVLILGGVGFIGRNLVQYLVENNLANQIRAVDKVLTSTANLGAGHAEAFNAPNVEVMQANLTSVGMISKYKKITLRRKTYELFSKQTSWYQKGIHSCRRTRKIRHRI